MTDPTRGRRAAVGAIVVLLCGMAAGSVQAACGDGALTPGEQCETPFTGCCNPATCTYWGGANRAAFDSSTGNCYLGFDGPTNWAGAKTACEGIGAALAVIDSVSENHLARSASDKTKQAWIGFSDSAVEAGKSPFGFAKASGGNLTFNGFRQGEPNSENDAEDCVHYFEQRTDWNDVACTASFPYICERGGSVGSSACTSTPATGCLASKAGTLHVRRPIKPSQHSLSFTWTNGPSLTKTDFGTPTTTDGYTLCLYDSGLLLASLPVAAGGLCGTHPCWEATTAGYRFSDAAGKQGGMRSIALRASSNAKSRIAAKAKGSSLPAIDLGGWTLVTAKLVHEGAGPCFEATFAGAGIKKNTTAGFKGSVE